MFSALELVQISDYFSSYLNVLWLHYFCYEQYLKIAGFKIATLSMPLLKEISSYLYVVFYLMKRFLRCENQSKFNILFCSSK